MYRHVTNINAAQLLSEWQKAGMLQPNESAQLAQFIQTEHKEKELPSYSRILTGIGAVIASLCFIDFLFAANIINTNAHIGLIVWSLLFAGVALFLAQRSGYKANTIRHSFFIQMSFCTMCVGKILFVLGFTGLIGNDSWNFSLALLIITAATYHVYRVSTDRFLSTLALLCSLFINIINQKYTLISPQNLLDLFLFAQILFAGILFMHHKIKKSYIPIANAIAFSLCIIVIFFATESQIGYPENIQIYNPFFMEVLFTLSLMGLIAWISRNLKKLNLEPLLLASAGTILLGIVSTPGIIFSICLMVLGYAKHEKFLLVLGILLMPLFIFIYYYNLDLSLMAKSGVLIASGAILLAGRGYLALKKLDREI